MPLNIPKSIRAGDTLSFTDSLPDYPASGGWTLNYCLASSNPVTLTSSASGDDHLIAKTAAETAAFLPGIYAYQAYVKNGAEEHTVEAGHLEILVNLRTVGAGYDGRTIAAKMVEILSGVLESRLGKEYAENEIQGLINRRVSLLTPEEIRTEYNYWVSQRDMEIQQERIEAGEPAGNQIKIRLSSGL